MIIGLTGKARSGKDTVGGFLKEAYGFELISFAKPLKDGLKLMLDLTEEHVNGELKEFVIERFGKSPRQMLQTLGTEWGRDCVNQNIWVIIALHRANQILQKGGKVCITDVRFNNEAEAVRNNGGMVLHISRDNAPVVNLHTSESGVEFNHVLDKVVQNNSSLDELFSHVKEIVGGK